MAKKTIVLTNDDGINSKGLQRLREELVNVNDLVCIAPGSPSSAISKALTFHKPIFYKKFIFDDGTHGYSTSGSPADNVLVAIHLLEGKPELVVSGINYGDNSSIHSMLTSGTCAAAFEAAFNSVPAVAFSANLSDDAQLIDQSGVNFETMAKTARKIVELVLQKEWPQDLAFLNVNFPVNVTKETEIYVTKPVLYKYDNYMVAKKDPRGLPYLWLWGERKPKFPEGSDTWAVLQKEAISISPIGFNLHDETDQSIGMAKFIRDNL